MSDIFTMWVIYDHPRDIPDVYVARLVAMRDGNVIHTPQILKSEDIETLRQWMLRSGLTCIPRDPSDDPVIVESWV